MKYSYLCVYCVDGNNGYEFYGPAATGNNKVLKRGLIALKLRIEPPCPEPSPGFPP